MIASLPACSGTDAQDRTECEQGCDFGDKTKGAPSVWKALLPVNTRPGGSYTIKITSSDSATPIVLERVTYGDVFFCSGRECSLALPLLSTRAAPAIYCMHALIPVCQICRRYRV